MGIVSIRGLIYQYEDLKNGIKDMEAGLASLGHDLRRLTDVDDIAKDKRRSVQVLYREWCSLTDQLVDLESTEVIIQCK